MVYAATTLRTSDQGLAMICKRMAVPRPAQGYWARKAAGKPITVILLSPAKAEIRSQITRHWTVNDQAAFDADCDRLLGEINPSATVLQLSLAGIGVLRPLNIG